LGGIFVLAGLAVFIEMQWDAMNSIARITVTLGSGIAAFAMAFVAMGDERFEEAATPLFLLAALMQPIGILVAIDEFSTGGDERHAFLLTSGVLLVQQLLVFFNTKRTVLLFTGLLFATAFYGTACGVVFLSTWAKSRSLLFVGTVAILGYVGYYTSEHFSDVVGWPIALILFGLRLIGLSAVAFWINRKYISAV
jgi:hypothetical protein